MKLSVIIVNYNVKYFLEQCLHSVLKAVEHLKAEVIVIDNNSSDGSIEYLLPEFQQVIFIKNEGNLGFGKANNLALRSARGEYILFLNPDTIVAEDCFEKCVHFLEAKPCAGALGIRMIDGTGTFLPESKRSFPTTTAAFYKLMGLSGLFPRSKHFNKYSLNYLDEHSNHAVEVLAGAFMMVRKKVLDSVGGFDEQFFMYGEDIDLSYRIKQAGFENWYFAESAIIHFKGESTKKASLKYLKMFYQAMIVFVNKHYNRKGAWFKRSVLKTGIALRGLMSWAVAARPSSRNTDTKKIIIGSAEEYNECLRILECPSGKQGGWLHINSSNKKEIEEQLAAFTGAEVIFNSSIAYSAILSIMQSLDPGFYFRFHASGSSSIVGSDSKIFTGEVVASH